MNRNLFVNPHAFDSRRTGATPAELANPFHQLKDERAFAGQALKWAAVALLISAIVLTLLQR